MNDLVTRLRTWFKDVNAVSAIDLMDEAADRIESDARQIGVLVEECQKLKDRCVNGERERWIPAGERLPDHGGTVVCRTAQRELHFGRVMTVTECKDGVKAVSHHWRGYPDGPLEVTHWMPLPEPPEVD